MDTRATGWIVCEGVTRPVVDALVDCPRQGRVMVVECLGCRLLVTSSAERSPRSFCVAESDDVLEAVRASAAHGQDGGSAAGLG